MNLVFTVRGESAQPVEALEPGSGVRCVGVNRYGAERHNVTVHDLELGRISVFHTRELEEVAEAEAIAVHLHSRHRLEQRDVFFLQQVGAADEHASRSIEQSCFARCHDRSTIPRSEENTSELQSLTYLVRRLLPQK